MLILVLNEFKFKNIHDPTLIDENRLGMALENINFQVELSDMICFISSNVVLEFLC